MILMVWEVYEENTQRCIIFAREEDARDQDVFSSVDIISKEAVDLSKEEIQRLLNGEYIWCN